MRNFYFIDEENEGPERLKLTRGQVAHSVVGLRLESRTDPSVEMLFLEDLTLINTQKNR